MKRNILRACIEIASIIFLLYTNLLMGEYMHSGFDTAKGFISTLPHIFTLTNFVIAFIGACIAYVVVELVRKYI